MGFAVRKIVSYYLGEGFLCRLRFVYSLFLEEVLSRPFQSRAPEGEIGPEVSYRGSITGV